MEDELEVYAELEGSELGEACLKLCGLVGHEHIFSSDFTEALKKEILEQVKYFKENTKIITGVRQEIREVVELEWND